MFDAGELKEICFHPSREDHSRFSLSPVLGGEGHSISVEELSQLVDQGIELAIEAMAAYISYRFLHPGEEAQQPSTQAPNGNQSPTLTPEEFEMIMKQLGQQDKMKQIKPLGVTNTTSRVTGSMIFGGLGDSLASNLGGAFGKR